MPEILLEEVSKKFVHRPVLFGLLGERRGTTQALHNISLSVARGEVLALLGPNGSGKTTLLKLICTMLAPDGGRVTVAGFDAEHESAEVRRRVGFALAHERSFYARLTARENLDFFAALEDVPRRRRNTRIDEVLELCGLSPSADLLTHKFSSGMVQRLSIARALLKQPDVLLLDEPTRSIDPQGSGQLWHSVRRMTAAGTAIVLATHDFEEAVALSDTVAILDRGALVAHSRSAGLQNTEALRDYYFRHICASIATSAGVGARA